MHNWGRGAVLIRCICPLGGGNIDKVCMGLLGEGIHSVGPKRAWLEGLGHGISKLGSQCWCCAGSHWWLCVYDEGNKTEMMPASSFVLGEVPQ